MAILWNLCVQEFNKKHDTDTDTARLLGESKPGSNATAIARAEQVGGRMCLPGGVACSVTLHLEGELQYAL